MPSLFTPGIGGVVNTADVDRLHDLAPGWLEDSFQLGRGPFRGRLSFGQTERLQFGVKAWSPGLLVRGSAPGGTTVLGLPLVDSAAGRVRGVPVAPHELGYVGAGEEVDFRSLTPYSLFIIVMHEEVLESYAETVLGRPLRSLARDNRLHGGRGAAARVRQLKRLGLETMYGAAHRLADARTASWVEDRILDAVMCGLPAVGGRHHVPGAANIARRAENYLLANLQAPLTVRDLCQAVDASERTLHQAFRRHLVTTPKAHLKALRLNAVRRDLKQAAPGVGVMDVAVRWGFFHAGWLSQDYRRMFGEAPSTTLLRRDRASPPA